MPYPKGKKKRCKRGKGAGVNSGPSILRPPMGPRKCGLILQVVLK